MEFESPALQADSLSLSHGGSPFFLITSHLFTFNFFGLTTEHVDLSALTLEPSPTVVGAQSLSHGTAGEGPLLTDLYHPYFRSSNTLAT